MEPARKSSGRGAKKIEEKNEENGGREAAKSYEDGREVDQSYEDGRGAEADGKEDDEDEDWKEDNADED